MSTAAYQREWRKRHSTGRPSGRPVTAPCGTVAAYKRHKRHGEEPCAACRAAYNEAQRGYYSARKRRQPPRP